MTNTDYLTQPIRTEADYQAALQLVAPYFEDEPEVASDAGKHFEAMVALIQAYEAKHYAIAPTDRVTQTTEIRRSNR